MPVADPSYLDTLADEILAGAVQSLSDNALEVPARRYVAPGSDAIDDMGEDCGAMLTVRFVRMFSGVPGAEISDVERAGYARTAEYVIRLVRCVYNEEPTPLQQAEDARAAMRDGWCILQGLLELAAAGSFLESCQLWAPGNLVSVGPLGGVAGIELPIQAQVTG